MIPEKYKDKEYAGIAGLPEFTKVSQALAYGSNSEAVASGRVSYLEWKVWVLKFL